MGSSEAKAAAPVCKDPVYQVLATRVDAYRRCVERGNAEWEAKHAEAISKLMADTAPSGGGIDNGTEIDLDASTGEKLVFHAGFHHMDENGMYDGWTEHTVTVVPSLTSRFLLKIGGRDRNDIKEYLHEVFREWLLSLTEL
jgi:hypothetical protein